MLFNVKIVVIYCIKQQRHFSSYETLLHCVVLLSLMLLALYVTDNLA